MPQRKVWTQDQDKILRLLKEERAERKWANIARIMETEFGIVGRTGKQCRERYHNHLDSSIIHSEWTNEEETLLLQMHQEFGNKWSVISQKLPGRSDNCVKNHFYSKLRKAVRRLNKIINDYFPTQHKFIKESVLSKIIKTTQSKFKNNSKIDEEVADFCTSIKNRLFSLQLTGGQDMEDAELAKKIVVDIETFETDHKKGYKGIKMQYTYQDKTFLQPPPKNLKKKSSTQSCSSVKSEDSSSSFLSSSSCFSSSDLSEFQPDFSYIKPEITRSVGTTSGRNSSDISKNQNISKMKEQDQPKVQYQNDNIIKPEAFQIEYQNLLLHDSDFYQRNNMREMQYNNMDFICEQSPQIGSILAPRQTFAPFYLFEKEEDKQEIQFKADVDKMDLE